MSNDELLKVLATLEQMRFKLQIINATCNVYLNEHKSTTKFFNDRHDARVAAGNQSLLEGGD